MIDHYLALAHQIQQRFHVRGVVIAQTEEKTWIGIRHPRFGDVLWLGVGDSISQAQRDLELRYSR